MPRWKPPAPRGPRAGPRARYRGLRGPFDLTPETAASPQTTGPTCSAHRSLEAFPLGPERASLLLSAPSRLLFPLPGTLLLQPLLWLTPTTHPCCPTAPPPRGPACPPHPKRSCSPHPSVLLPFLCFTAPGVTKARGTVLTNSSYGLEKERAPLPGSDCALCSPPGPTSGPGSGLLSAGVPVCGGVHRPGLGEGCHQHQGKAQGGRYRGPRTEAGTHDEGTEGSGTSAPPRPRRAEPAARQPSPPRPGARGSTQRQGPAGPELTS